MNIDCLFAQDEERTPARTRHIKRTHVGMGMLRSRVRTGGLRLGLGL